MTDFHLSRCPYACQKMCTTSGESWVIMVIPVDPHPHAAFWGHGPIHVIWCFCLKNHLLAFIQCSSIVGFFLVILFGLAAVPFHTTICFCAGIQLTPGRGLVHATPPHPLPWPGDPSSTSSHRRGKMALGDANCPKSRLLIEGWLVLNCNTLLLAMLTSCQISNSLNI